MPYKDPKQKKEYNIRYRKANREKINAINRKSWQKNVEKRNASKLKYYLGNKTEIIERTFFRRRKQRQEIIAKLGNECFVCHRKMKGRYLCFHEIHGTPHDHGNLYYTLNHLKDFIPLCSRCHLILNNLGSLTDEQFQRFMELFQKLNK